MYTDCPVFLKKTVYKQADVAGKEVGLDPFFTSDIDRACFEISFHDAESGAWSVMMHMER